MDAPANARQASPPAVISAAAVLSAGLLTLAMVEIGPLSVSMAQHLAIMNVAAPLVAAALLRHLPPRANRSLFLWVSAVSQIVLLWAWHVPALQRIVASSAGLHLGMVGALALAAVLFWTLLLRAGAASRWTGLAALLLTGKLACLLGALLIFAPRDLYSLPGVSFAHHSLGPSTLADQHLAGLLMITACPLSYIVAGVVLAAQMMADLERRSRTPGKSEPLAAS